MNYLLQGGMVTASVLDEFDMAQKMPMLSIVCMGISLAITVLLPIAFLLILRKRVQFSMRGILIGMGAYILSLMLAYNGVAYLIFQIPGAQEYFQNSKVMSSLVGTVLSLILEFLGLVLGIKFLSRKGISFSEVVMFTFGFAAVIMLVSSATNQFGMLMNGIMINSQGLQTIFDSMKGSNVEQLEQAAIAYNEVLQAHPTQFLVEGVNSIFSFTLRAFECLMIYGVISRKCSGKTMVAAVAGEVIFNIPLVLYAVGMIDSRWLVEFLFMIVLAVLGYYIWCLLKTNLAEEWKILTTDHQVKVPEKKKMPKIVMPKE